MTRLELLQAAITHAGGVRPLARQLTRDPATISRWRGEREPIPARVVAALRAVLAGDARACVVSHAEDYNWSTRASVIADAEWALEEGLAGRPSRRGRAQRYLLRACLCEYPPRLLAERIGGTGDVRTWRRLQRYESTTRTEREVLIALVEALLPRLREPRRDVERPDPWSRADDAWEGWPL